MLDGETLREKLRRKKRTWKMRRGGHEMQSFGRTQKAGWMIAWRRRIRQTIRQRPCSHIFYAARGWRDSAEFIRRRRTVLCARCWERGAAIYGNICGRRGRPGEKTRRIGTPQSSARA